MNNFIKKSNKLINLIETKLERKRLLSRPLELIIEPTARCNLMCKMCSRQRRELNHYKKSGFISMDILKLLRPYYKYAYAVLYTGFGEPLLHPQFIEHIKYLKSKASFVYIITNGQLLNKDIAEGIVNAELDQIVVSLDSPDPGNYKEIRGSELTKVISNLEYLKAVKRKNGKLKPVVNIDMIGMKSNIKYLNMMLELSRDLGVYQLQILPFVPLDKQMNSESLWNDKKAALKKFSESAEYAKHVDIKFVFPDFIETKKDCKQIFKNLIITWNGDVLSCPFEHYICGNIHNEKNIWNNKNHIKLRQIYFNKGLKELCPTCPCFDYSYQVIHKNVVHSRDTAKNLMNLNLQEDFCG